MIDPKIVGQKSRRQGGDQHARRVFDLEITPRRQWPIWRHEFMDAGGGVDRLLARTDEKAVLGAPKNRARIGEIAARVAVVPEQRKKGGDPRRGSGRRADLRRWQRLNVESDEGDEGPNGPQPAASPSSGRALQGLSFRKLRRNENVTRDNFASVNA